MTFLDGDDDLDPMLAERFRLLDRLTPPTEVRRMAPTEPPVIVLDEHRSRHQLLWVAAALAVIAAASIALVLDRGPSSGVDTTDPADGPTVTAERGADDDTVSSGRLEARDPDAPEAGLPGAPDADGQSSPSPAASAGDGSERSTSTGPESSTSSRDTSDSSTSATSATTGPAGPTTVTTRPASSGAASTVASTPTTAGTTTTTTASTTTKPDKDKDKDKRTVVKGLVTEVFTDCVSHLALENGEVVSRNPVSCDGGSWIIVDGRRIQTSSGMTAGGGFDNHDPDLRPGQQATVNAVSPAGGGGLTLDCPGCHIVAR